MAKSIKKSEQEKPRIKRAPLPKGEQVIGIVEKRHGGNKMQVNCTDKKSRNCRVPGRLRRRLWLRPGDAVIIQPWELDKDKGDILLKYNSSQVQWLKKNGYLQIEDEEF